MAEIHANKANETNMTNAPKCIYIEGGTIKTSDGACGTTTNTGTTAVIPPISETIPSPAATSLPTGQAGSVSEINTATSTPTIITATSTPIIEPVIATTTEPVIITATSTTTMATTTP